MPNLASTVPIKDRIVAIQRYIEAFEYNHTGTQFFAVDKRKPLCRLLKVRVAFVSAITCRSTNSPWPSRPADCQVDNARGSADQVPGSCSSGAAFDLGNEGGKRRPPHTSSLIHPCLCFLLPPSSAFNAAAFPHPSLQNFGLQGHSSIYQMKWQ